MRFVPLAPLVTLITCFPQVYTQQLLLGLSSDESPEIPCYGQEMTNGSFHIGKIKYTSEQIYYYDQIFERSSNRNLDCTFNGPTAAIGFGPRPYNWNIDRIDIVSSGGLNCLGGGVGYPWYRFRLYGLGYKEYTASVWITWRGSSVELSADPAYLVQCVQEGTNQVVRPNQYIF